MADGNGSAAVKLPSASRPSHPPTPGPITTRRVIRRVPGGLPSKVPTRERHFGVEVGPEQIRDLVELIQYDGLPKVAEYMGLDSTTVLRVCAGLMHMCRLDTQHKIRAFFAK